MKVVISADSIRHPLTGIGRYVWQLSDALEQLTQAPTLSYLRHGQIQHQLPELASLTQAQHRAAFQHRLKSLKLSLPGIDIAADRLALQRSARTLQRANPDVFHGTNFDLLPSRAASVVTIHDLSVLAYPQYHPRTRVRKITRRTREAVHGADIVITVSEAIRQELLDFFRLPPQRVIVTHLAASPDYQPLSQNHQAKRLSAFGLEPDKYCLYCGTIEPRKNLLTLVGAYRRLPATLRRTFPLVVAGGAGWNNSAELRTMKNAMDEGWLKYLGYADQTGQIALYSGCRVFVFPSHYEGFGLPLLEAMSCGAPTICSTDPALVEVAGNAAETFAPTDMADLAKLLEGCLLDDDWATRSRRMGLARASEFSWRATAERTLDAYRLALDSKG